MLTAIELVPHARWPDIISDVIAVRTSAYLDWNGPKAQAEQQDEAESWLNRWAPRRGVILFAAKIEGKLVGYLIADERQSGEYYIGHIGVHSDSKRRGVGRALVRRCVCEAASRGYRAVCTTTYNRYPGMLILLIQEGVCIQEPTWSEEAREPRISLRKELKK